ncbi:hypothetical protein LTR66_006820 [Elasticomyces elasticus]|nr:hypothetical protein LTR66_006820 [Elasticomyces elasticus]
MGHSGKIRIVFFSNEFPNDNLEDLFRRLHQHSKDKRHTVLARFIYEATQAVRDEVSRLPTELKHLVPAFESVLRLADDSVLRQGRLRSSFDGVLLAVLQLATFIGYHERSGIEFFRTDSVDVDDVVTGLGIGLLVSAAVALSRQLDDIVMAGAEVIRIAFRMGIHVFDVSQNLEASDLEGSSDPWAHVVHGVCAEEAQAELTKIQQREKTPEASKIFISANSQTSVTVSGPPSRLKALFRTSAFFRDRKHFSLPVYGGLCHAPHIYTQNDVHRVVHASRHDGRLKPQCAVISVHSGKTFVANSATELLEAIVAEIMTDSIVWDNAVKGIVERAISGKAFNAEIMVFQLSLPVNDLTHGLSAISPDSAVATKNMLSWIAGEGDPGDRHEPRGPMQSKIAIVGMSCRMLGGATSTEKFWELLRDGLDVHRRIPADRFDVETHSDVAGGGKRVNTSYTPYGCFIDEPGMFDAPFFNMSPREAQQTDPMQRLALVTAYEALERAGYVANRTPATKLDRIGTWYGQASDDYREVNSAQEISTYFIPGGCRAFGPGRINYFFKFAGPSFNCDTACSSSLATLQAACTALWAGDVDTVVAGGVNVLTNPDAFAGLCNGHFLSKTPNACKTWDCDADGYCRADGVGSIVMKRLEDAEADNDNILGVILSAATNHSANAVSITHPHAGHQADLYRQTMARAGVDPLDVSFVEVYPHPDTLPIPYANRIIQLHGTGTQAGDFEEMQSVTEVFAPARKGRGAKQPLHLGAVKSNVGHGEAAAGITAVLKVLLMLQKGMIPKHVGIKSSINPLLPKDLDKRKVYLPYENTVWAPHGHGGKKRVAVVNNFSAAGGNTTIAIEEAPAQKVAGYDPRPSHVVIVSAKSKISLKGNIERLVEYLDHYPSTSLANLSYTTAARRYRHNHRVAVHSTDIAGIKQQLTARLDEVQSIRPLPATGPPPVAFVFTGQGAEKSMSLQLYHNCPSFAFQIHQFDALAQRQGFPSIITAMEDGFPSDADRKHSPAVTQLALVCIQLALVKYWETLGVRPSVVMGHSLGEYAAFVAAGVLSASDAIYLVGSRALLLEKNCQIGSHKMVAVEASAPDIEKVIKELVCECEIACINGPMKTVLAGSTSQVERIVPRLQERGYRCIVLDVDFAFHSAQMDPVLDKFTELAHSGVLFQVPKVPVISPLLGKVVFDDKTINADYLRRATRGTVGFAGALEKAQAMSIIEEDTIWLEIGPHPVSVSFVKAASTFSAPPVTTPSMRRGENNFTTIAQSLALLECHGVQCSWNEFHRPFEGALRLLDLPTYAWNDKNYWIQYNGDWALTKGNTFYDAEKGLNKKVLAALATASGIKTSLVHQVIEETFQDRFSRVVVQSDLMHTDFFAAAHGHRMNGCGVVTSSIHADVAFTLGEHLCKMLRPGKRVDMNMCNLEVSKGLIAQNDSKTPQLIQISATTADIEQGVVDLKWHTIDSNGIVSEPFATANIIYGDSREWLASWRPMTHLIEGRIKTLEHLAVANRFSGNMAYKLFAANLVDYADKYRGMQAVVMNEFEAFADVQLAQSAGDWTVPPHFIDSVAHLAGFVMNVSDASDTAKTFCVTPGWSSMRFAKPLVAGAKYRSYVKMIPSEDPSIYLGDVYVMQAGEIIGLVGGIKFRRYPRILLDRFFSAPDSAAAKSHAAEHHIVAPAPIRVKAAAAPAPAPARQETTLVHAPAPAPAAALLPVAAPAADMDSTTMKALLLIARETGLEVAGLTKEASFDILGIDSLMSLVIAEKFRADLGINVAGSLFLEYPTIGALKSWLDEYHG